MPFRIMIAEIGQQCLRTTQVSRLNSNPDLLQDRTAAMLAVLLVAAAVTIGLTASTAGTALRLISS